MIESLTNKELDIMKLLWESTNGITYKGLCNSIQSKNDSISPKTINTHLIHLIDKGFVRAEGVRRKRLYFPKISRPEYDKFLAQRIVNQVFEGSLRNFVSAFTFNEELPESEVLALKALLEQEGE